MSHELTMAGSNLQVEEFQGLYGAYQVSELVLQGIWDRGAFDRDRLIGHRGQRIHIVDTGVWNRLDGPDFKGATIEVDGALRVGDIEVHFAHDDWFAHGHQHNRAYGNVILHVVYHPLRGDESPIIDSQDREAPVVSLMPLLWYDLEEYAEEDSIVASTKSRPASPLELLLPMERANRRAYIVESARKRWEKKVHFASLRVSKLGWAEACHQTACEILGYRYNRAPMLVLAARYPYSKLSAGHFDAETLYDDVSEFGWKLRGLRPANHPRLRIAQYLAVLEKGGNWAERLESGGANWFGGLGEPGFDADNGVGFRKRFDVGERKRLLARNLLGGGIGGTRLDTLICDGLMPLVATRGDFGMSDALFSLWFHWFAGDAPSSVFSCLREAELCGKGNCPKANGWVQGVLGLTR